MAITSGSSWSDTERHFATTNEINHHLELFKLEYQQLAESYRHTYATIWQAGSVFTAISAGLLAFGVRADLNSQQLKLIMIFWALPFLFWWIGIFTPMDRYGKLRFERLRTLENGLLQHGYYYRMNHFSLAYTSTLGWKQKLISFSWIRVGYAVDIFAIATIAVWVIGILMAYGRI